MAPREYWDSLSVKLRYALKAAAVYLSVGVALLTIANLTPTVWRHYGMPAIAFESVVDQKIEARVAPLANSMAGFSVDLENLASESAETRRSQVDESIFKWTAELAKAGDNPPLQQMIQGRLRDLQIEHDAIVRRLEQLQRAKYGPR